MDELTLWTLQRFLGITGVSTVRQDTTYGVLQCDCSVYERSQKCKHIGRIQMRLDLNDGEYPFRWEGGFEPPSGDMEFEDWEQMVLDHGTVEIDK